MSLKYKSNDLSVFPFYHNQSFMMSQFSHVILVKFIQIICNNRTETDWQCSHAKKINKNNTKTPMEHCEKTGTDKSQEKITRKHMKFKSHTNENNEILFCLSN